MLLNVQGAGGLGQLSSWELEKIVLHNDVLYGFARSAFAMDPGTFLLQARSGTPWIFDPITFYISLGQKVGDPIDFLPEHLDGDEQFIQSVDSNGSNIYAIMKFRNVSGVSYYQLYTISETGVATQVGTLANFGVTGITDPYIAWLAGTMYMVDSGTLKMYNVNLTTGFATPISELENFGLADDVITTDAGPFDIGSFFEKDGNLWMGADNRVASSGEVPTDGISAGQNFELSTSPNVKRYIREGSDFSVDLSQHVLDATGYVFATGYTAPAWVTITDGELTGTVPTVLADTEITVLLTASNVHGATDFSVNLVLVDLAPTVETTPTLQVSEGDSLLSDLNLFVSSPRDDALQIIATTFAFQSGYTAPAWLTLTSAGVLSGISPNVQDNTDYTVEVRVTSDFGFADFDVIIRVLDGSPYQTQDIPIQAVTEGNVYDLNLATYTDFGTDYEFTAGYTPPSWLSLVGSNISGTAPAVTADTEVTLEVTISNADGSLDLEIPLTIRNGIAPAVPPLASQALISGIAWSVDLRTLVPLATSFTFQSDYTPPSWLALGSNNVLSTDAAPEVTGQNLVVVVRLVAANLQGSVDFSLTLIVQPQNEILGAGITQNAEQYQGFQEFEILLDITARDASTSTPTAGSPKALRVPALVIQDLSSLASFTRTYSLTYIGASQVIVLRQPINGLRTGDLIFKTLNQDVVSSQDFTDNVDRYWIIESIDFIAENQKQVITAQFVLTLGAL